MLIKLRNFLQIDIMDFGKFTAIQKSFIKDADYHIKETTYNVRKQTKNGHQITRVNCFHVNNCNAKRNVTNWDKMLLHMLPIIRRVEKVVL